MTYPWAVDFEWDPAKDRENQRKHGISFADAVRVFDSEELCLDIFDEAHSDAEERFMVRLCCHIASLSLCLTSRVCACSN